MSANPKSPDVTTRMLREHTEAHARASRAAPRFTWPAPPYFEYVDAAWHNDECMLVFRDGAKASGRLIDLLPDAAELKFRSHDAADIVSIRFSSLLMMQFPHPVALRRQPVKIDDTEELYAVFRAYNAWLDEDWGYDRDGRIQTGPMLSLMDAASAN